MNLLLKRPPIIMLIISVLGFVYSSTLKSKKEIFNKKISYSQSFSGAISVLKGDTFKFAFSTLDEESSGFSEWPDAKACILVKDEKEKTIVNDTIEDGGYIDVGLRRAQAIKEYNVTPDFNGKMSFYFQLLDGKEAELIIYKNIEDWRNLLPALFIILFIFSVFWTLKKKQK